MIDGTHLKAPRTAATLLKKFCSQTYRTHQRLQRLGSRHGPHWHRSPATRYRDHPIRLGISGRSRLVRTCDNSAALLSDTAAAGPTSIFAPLRRLKSPIPVSGMSERVALWMFLSNPMQPERASLRRLSINCTGIKPHQLLYRAHKLHRLCTLHAARRLPIAASMRASSSQTRAARLIVENAAKHERCFGVAFEVVGYHRAEPKFRFRAKLQIGITAKGAIGLLRSRENRCCASAFRRHKFSIPKSPDQRPTTHCPPLQIPPTSVASQLIPVATPS